MLNKILTETFRDLSSHAETPILSKLQFDSEIAQMHKTFNELVNTYDQLVEKKAPEVYQYNQNVDYFTFLYNHPDSNKEFLKIVNQHRIEFNFIKPGGESTRDKVIRLFRENNQEIECKLKALYDELVTTKSTEVGDWDFISLHYWLSKKWEGVFNANTYISFNEVENVEKLFLYQNKQKHNPIDEECIKRFEATQRAYLKPYWNIMSTLEKYLRAERVTQNTKAIVNVGKIECTTNYRVNRGLSDYNEFTIEKDGNEFNYYKTSDVKQINGRIIIIYLISDKSFIKLLVNENSLIGRAEYLIRKDIKKIEISEDHFLKIHFHRYNDWETLVMKDYQQALELQKFIISFR